MGKATAVCLDNLRRWATNPRIFLIALLTLLMEDQMMVGGIRAFSTLVDIAVTPWVYPFLTGDWYIALMELFGAILLFCDAPFMNQGTPYLFIRSGRAPWFMGQVLYIFSASAIYQLFIAAGAALLLLPRLMWSEDWGKVLGTLAQTEQGLTVGIRLADTVVRDFSPAQAMPLSFLLCWMVTVLFGMVIFAVNLVLPRLWGAVCAAVLALVMPFSINASGRLLQYFSPGSWMCLPLVDFRGTSPYPSLRYVLAAGWTLIGVLTALSYWRYRKQPVDALPDL